MVETREFILKKNFFLHYLIFVFFKYQCGSHSCLTLYLLNPITNQLNHIIFKTGLGISMSKIHQMIIVCIEFMYNTKDKLVSMIQFYHVTTA